MVRSPLGRTNPQRKTQRVVTESKETISGFVQAPNPSDTIVAWMASGAGTAGPFVFRVEQLAGTWADFEISIYQPSDRSQMPFSIKQGADALKRTVQVGTGDRIVIRFVGVKERAQGAAVPASGVWASFTFTRSKEKTIVDDGE